MRFRIWSNSSFTASTVQLSEVEPAIQQVLDLFVSSVAFHEQASRVLGLFIAHGYHLDVSNAFRKNRNSYRAMLWILENAKGQIKDSSTSNWITIIDWFAPGKGKLELLDCLIDEYNQDIDSNGDDDHNHNLLMTIIKRYEKFDDEFWRAVLRRIPRDDLEVKRPCYNRFSGCYCGGAKKPQYSTPLEYAISLNEFEIAISLIKAGARLDMFRPEWKAEFGRDNFTQLIKMVEIRGFSYKNFFGGVRRWKEELDLADLWVSKVPTRRGTLIELATIALRKQFTYEKIKQLIGNRTVDPIVDFFAVELYD